ncbi:type III-A CRISPR-associated RAMP protein Csm3 [Thermodesulfatator autotrophicus]|uniref:CRISPR system Cms endoribonuclease Csm3 n=1 Tax=Thermodesulfatator autotrophicus TaxID=1795632 RepID=A0A177E5D4_9BACT|nr:type III-A CRISPR-associated RAMP protein Csm3 [Thermodesulfatator autotrophicus]OAG26711.1 hypothetical protein TH606_10905 [Thermodesulfatator autotrophicus]
MSETRQNEKPILGKVIISGILHCETGLHIGASKENLEIGAIDSPVVRDPITREPYIPGSSLKGKMRSLLEKVLALSPNRNGGTQRNPIWRHECDMKEEAKKCKLCRLFGSTGKSGGGNWPARLIVRDAFLTDNSRENLQEIDTGLLYTEWKWENSLDRVTAAANPRQLERVPRGTEFRFEIVYTVEDLDDLNEDLENIDTALKLLEMDYLGGHGSRGYGQIKLRDLKWQIVTIKNGEIKGSLEKENFKEIINTLKTEDNNV